MIKIGFLTTMTYVHFDNTIVLCDLCDRFFLMLIGFIFSFFGIIDLSNELLEVTLIIHREIRTLGMWTMS